jgi:2'-5' RNA ligase
LHFIGAVPRARVAAIASRLRIACGPFDLTLGVHALWRNGIAALEPAARSEPLAALHAMLAASLAEMELPVEHRRYRPHVTLAREAQGSVAPAVGAAIVWRVTACVLVESRPDGRYDVV